MFAFDHKPAVRDGCGRPIAVVGQRPKSAKSRLYGTHPRPVTQNVLSSLLSHHSKCQGCNRIKLATLLLALLGLMLPLIEAQQAFQNCWAAIEYSFFLDSPTCHNPTWAPQAESTRTMIERVEVQFDLMQERLKGKIAYGTAPMLAISAPTAIVDLALVSRVRY